MDQHTHHTKHMHALQTSETQYFNFATPCMHSTLSLLPAGVEGGEEGAFPHRIHRLHLLDQGERELSVAQKRHHLHQGRAGQPLGFHCRRYSTHDMQHSALRVQFVRCNVSQNTNQTYFH